ncbi:MAG: hypothetical protein AAGC46_08250 [Solirubrobacteraceae bacterium]|nr:hypothetical protein [Patulibacter sp.]
MPPATRPAADRPRAARLLACGALAAVLTLSACGGRNPFEAKAGKGADAAPPAATSSNDSVVPPSTAGIPQGATPAPAASPASTSPSGDSPVDRTPQPPLPSTAANAPAPAGTTAAVGTQHGPTPTTLAGRISADKTAMLNVRTMVSVIEGCHSGRPSYRDCNTHAELGSPQILGVEIGKRRGQVQIAATKNGFRMTARSLSGAKFTVARGPKGDRFKCIPGPKPGACPESRTWSW